MAGSGWSGFWIMIGLMTMFYGLGNRVDCWLKVPGACEALADDYVKAR